MPTDPVEKAKVVELAEGFYVRVAIDNMAWIDLGEDIVVVDALEENHLEGEVFSAISSTMGDRTVRYVLNTHTHYDHTALNKAFQRRFGSEIVNQTTTPIPQAGRWFKGSRRRLLMLGVPGCHTAEDCIVWSPQDKALFVGDIFGWGLIPLTQSLTDKTAQLLLDTYRRLIEYEASVVIPGHGPLCTTAELQRWVQYFEQLRKDVAYACAASKTDQEIVQEITVPADMQTWWRFTLWKHQDSLTKTLQAIRARRLSVPTA